MKRWQDRGEVEDSEDDDDLSLDSESTSQERPWKRTKLGQDVGIAEEVVTVPDAVQNEHANPIENGNEDDNGWKSTKVAKTYGRRGRVRAIAPPQSHQSSGDEVDISRNVSEQTGSGEDHAHTSSPIGGRRAVGGGDEAQLANTTTSRIGKLDTEMDVLAPPMYRAAQLSSTALHRRPREHSRRALPEETPSSSVDELQTVQETGPSRSKPDVLPQWIPMPTMEVDEFPRITDLMSSPLSERDVSPPAELLHLERERPAGLIDDDLAFGTEDFAIAGGSAANARRSLRARKEVQLHPYMYDKAQYQKQFRERGLQPIRVVEQDNTNEETQSVTHSDSGRNADTSSAMSTQSAEADPVVTARRPIFNLDFLNSADSSSESEAGTAPQSYKRGRLYADAHARSHDGGAKRQDQLPLISANSATPLSPPRTSSEMSTPKPSDVSARRKPAKFRLPPGYTPAPLPTPHVSSVSKNAGSGRGSSARPRGLSVASSTGSSSSEDDEEAMAILEARRLRREQKRIKGVLPASWLRIDYRKQTRRDSPSPIRRRLSSTSPPRSEQRRGVARKIVSTRARSPASNALSDANTTGHDSDVSMEEAAGTDFDFSTTISPSNAPDTQGALFDDDRGMENDFIDPMLAGGGGLRRPRKKTSRRKQPLITQAFPKMPGEHTAFSNERIPWGSSRGKAAPRYAQQRKRRPITGRTQAPAVRLSIADAPRSPSTVESELPQFVSLALRRTRKSPNQGRHSPNFKHIRLATANDTKEATSVLQAWRAGSLAPRQPASRAHRRDAPPDLMSSGDADPDAFAGIMSTEARPVNTLSGPTARRRPRLRQLRIVPAESHNRTGISAAAASTQSGVRLRVFKPTDLPRLRGGQLETLESEFISANRSAAFGNRMHQLTETSAFSEDRVPFSGFQLARFLRAGNQNKPETPADFRAGLNEDVLLLEGGAEHRPNQGIPHRPRKAHAHRIDAGAREYWQPSEPLPDVLSSPEPPQVSADVSGDVLQGLGAFGTRYPIDFDVRPLSLGTHFQTHTFIGSEEFNDVLKIPKRNLSHDTGRIRVHVDGDIFEWGAWNEDVAVHFINISRVIREALSTLDNLNPVDDDEQRSIVDRNVDYLLRSVLRYCSKCIWFVDVVDRQMCVHSLGLLVTDLTDATGEREGSTDSLPRILTRIAQYQLAIATAARLLGDHPIVSQDTRKHAEQLVSCTALHLARTEIIGNFDEVRRHYEDASRVSKREAGIASDAWTLSSIVILSHAARGGRAPGTFFWRTISEAINADISHTCAVKDLEAIWYNLFTLLPALEFDAMGTACVGSRLTSAQDDWGLPQRLVGRVLELYETSSNIRGYSVNEYLRAVLSRCYTLISAWGWSRCESVLNLMYDFFSRRGLGLLKKEENRGSPKFLDLLGTQDASLEVQPDDNSFHIFLKTLAVGLQRMRGQAYTDRKIQGIVWRFIPNHNRTHRKDADVERASLDSLRNHHDLLCTLYFASPPGHRPGVHLLRALVDHTTSHREACRLNVRSWAHLASFQAATKESAEELRPLTDWYADIVAATMTQYRLAKSEAQSDFDRAKAEGAQPSEAMLETTIANNQRQIAATIVDALAGLKRAMSSSSNLPHAMLLVEGTSFWRVLELFDPSQRRLLSAMIEALRVVSAAVDAENRFSITQTSQSFTEDSQEFGDSTALQEFVANNESSNETPTSLSSVLLSPVAQFVSNVMGADTAPDESLLHDVVDVWVRLASMTVKTMGKSWLSYLDEYSAMGWNQMRNTAQKRKFTAYFVSRVVDLSDEDDEIRQHVLTAWLQSMVEREALVKFQHVLTNAVLNQRGDDPLLQNLPFAKDTSTGQYSISLTEVRQRRLALISAVLCNMRNDYEDVIYERPSAVQQARRIYTAMLQQLMRTMKSNYEELQTSCTRPTSDDNVQDAYVEFVQQVVSFLQQHTADICPVDRFFTDSGAFPLPADDPTYVVGKLRRYISKLNEPGTRKSLAGFVHTVAERAVVEQQQQYLVNQITIAVKGPTETGDVDRPTLRHVLLTSIFPAYIENSLETPCSWIPVIPILNACQQIIPDLLYSVRVEDERSGLAVVECIVAVLQCVNEQCKKALTSLVGSSGLPHVLRWLSAAIAIGTSSLTVISFIARSTSYGTSLRKEVSLLRKMSSMLETQLCGSNDAGILDSCPSPASPVQSPWHDTRKYADNQIKGSLNANWQARDGAYYLWRNSGWKEVAVDLGTVAWERAELLRVVVEFQQAYHGTSSSRMRRMQPAEYGLGCIYI